MKLLADFKPTPAIAYMFVTGTAAEVTPIAKNADDHTFTVGEITKTLMQDYDDQVNGRAEAAAAE